MPRRGNYLPPPSLSKLRNSRRHPDSEINSVERVISSRFTLVSQAFRAALPPAQQGDMCQEEWTAGKEKGKRCRDFMGGTVVSLLCHPQNEERFYKFTRRKT